MESRFQPASPTALITLRSTLFPARTHEEKPSTTHAASAASLTRSITDLVPGGEGNHSPSGDANKEFKMKRMLLTGSMAVWICLGLAAPLLAAEPAPSGAPNPPSSSKETTAAVKPAEKCLSDIRAFESQMQKDGFWLGSPGYGYPTMGGYGFGYGFAIREGGDRAVHTEGYQNARPGYDLRTLIAAGNILARDGQQQACEGVLAATHDSYKLYVAEMHSRKMPMADIPGWQKRQIAAAQPVTAKANLIRSDQLVGTEVRNPQNDELGSVDDVVMSPQNDEIAYLIIARGGFLGIDEKYVAVPWSDFKVTPSASLLVLNSTKAVMAAGPLVSHDQFAKDGLFDQESQKVDAYWKTHLSDNGAAKTNK
jgi:sporulation protein YlmC with PRC-barrel domain